MTIYRSSDVVHHPPVADVGERFISAHTLRVLGRARDGPDGGVAVLPLLPGLRVAGAQPGAEVKILRGEGGLVTAGILTSQSAQSGLELVVT